MTQVDLAQSLGKAVSTTEPIDPALVMLKATLELSEINSTRASRRAYDLNDDRDRALRGAREALKAAREAKEEGGFFRKYADELSAVAVVASVTATVATAGAGAPTMVAALALTSAACSAGSYAMKKTGCDGTLCKLDIGGTELDIKWSDAVMLAGIAAGAGGAVAGASASTAASEGGQRAAQKAGEKAAEKAVEEGSTSVLAEVCVVVKTLAQLTNAGATAGQAYFTVKAGFADARSFEHEADSTEGKARSEQKQIELEDAIDEVRSAMELRTKAAKTASAMLEAKQAAMSAILRRA
jgi:hypothetical protein